MKHKRRFPITRSDFIIAGLLILVLLYVFHRVTTQLHYQWNFKAVLPYFLYRDESGLVPNLLLKGLFTTIRLSIWGMALSIFIGMIMGFLSVSPYLFHRLIAKTYVEVSRNLPPLIIIFIFYFFIGDQLMPILKIANWVNEQPPWIQKLLTLLFAPPSFLTAFFSAIITLAIFEGAYITEIVRGGIESIDKGQWEAAYALGMSRFKVMRLVIFPQAFKRMLPPLGGQFISTIKDSAIVSVISIQELTFQGLEIMATTFLTFEIWITITILYFILTFTCSLIVSRFEQMIRRSLTPPAS